MTASDAAMKADRLHTVLLSRCWPKKNEASGLAGPNASEISTTTASVYTAAAAAEQPQTEGAVAE